MYILPQTCTRQRQCIHNSIGFKIIKEMKNLFTICICLLTLTYLPGCIQSNESYLNEGASILKLEDLPENPLLLHPLTSSINPNDSTMATLYGNDLAMSHTQVY